ncbi:MAG TPA: Calx-beta domain-containing protein, partial [Verrucomicrobiae bacterium]|nr:Calx-beta domain-containing protein [Verrucomicrobiae bacterium]
MAIPLLVVWWVVTAFSGLAFAQQTGTVFFSQSSYFVNIDQTNEVINVDFTGSTDTVATVDFATSDGTATAGVNYVASTGTVTFATNTLVATFNVSILGNVALQSTQTVNLVLSNATGGATLGTPSTATLSIINTNAQQLAFLQSAFSVNGDQSDAVITVVRIGGTNGTVSADFSTSDGTAKAGIDYTTATGTVTFADGVLTNTFMVPIVLPEKLLSTNQTVNLALSNPQGAVLASPSDAVLTIVANGPTVLQFGAATYHVHEHVGRATVTVLRFGDSSGTATVDYATSDGTAKSGVDYLSTNGTLVLTAGVESASFSFQFVEFQDFQSNKTVIATLSNAGGGILGTQTTAVVTIVNDVTQTITLTNGGGDLVTMTLQRAGTMQTTTTEPVDIVLSDTDETSLLAIRVKKHGAGPGLLEVDGITGDGECRSINAPGVDLVGSGVQVNGYLKLLAVHDILNGAGVIAGGNTNNDTKIKAHDIDGATIDVTSRIESLTAARFVAGTINAPRLFKMVLRGDKRNGISGDCEAAITLSGDGVPAG